MRVMIGCVVRNRAWILPEYLKAIEAIEHDGKTIGFLENDSDDNTLDILEKSGHWILTTTTGYPNWKRGKYSENQYEHLATMRNKFLNLFMASEAEYLLSIDSDVIVPPDILTRLLAEADGRTIIGAAISNVPGQEIDGSTPGNFMIKQDDRIIHPPTYPLAGTMTVDVIGAAYLIPRSAILEGVRYGQHPQGEDIAFSQAAQEHGYQLKVILDLVCEHRMTNEKG